MRFLKNIAIVLIVAMLICGCGKAEKIPKINAETEAATETMTSEPTTTLNYDEETNYLGKNSYTKKCDITGGNIEYTIVIDEEKASFLITAETDNTEKANIVYLTLMAMFEQAANETDNIDCLLTVKCKEGTLTYGLFAGQRLKYGTDGNGEVIEGYNLPEWCNTDVDFDIEGNKNCLHDVTNSFSEFVSEAAEFKNN